jgi:hypothetical protein
MEQHIQANTTLSSGSASYAKVTASANKPASAMNVQTNEQRQSIGAQTDLTWPINSDRPFPHLHSEYTATVQTDTSV